MIRIEKSGRASIHVVFDAAGANELATVFCGKQGSIAVSADRTLWKSRRAGHGFRDVKLEVVRDEARDLLIAEPECLLLMLDSESMDMIADRLRVAGVQGFFPAEMAEVMLDDHSGQLVTLYGRFDSDCANVQPVEERND